MNLKRLSELLLYQSLLIITLTLFLHFQITNTIIKSASLQIVGFFVVLPIISIICNKIIFDRVGISYKTRDIIATGISVYIMLFVLYSVFGNLPLIQTLIRVVIPTTIVGSSPAFLSMYGNLSLTKKLIFGGAFISVGILLFSRYVAPAFTSTEWIIIILGAPVILLFLLGAIRFAERDVERRERRYFRRDEDDNERRPKKHWLDRSPLENATHSVFETEEERQNYLNTATMRKKDKRKWF